MFPVKKLECKLNNFYNTIPCLNLIVVKRDNNETTSIKTPRSFEYILQPLNHKVLGQYL